MHTFQRDPECARSWTYIFRGSGDTGEVCSSPFGQYTSSHRFPSSKTKQADELLQKIATGTKMENALYH